MQSKTQCYAVSFRGQRQSAAGGSPSGQLPSRREIQTFLFPIDPEQPQAHSVPGHVVREMFEIADRLGRLGHESITDVLWRECGETLGAQARNVIANEFLAERAERQRAFLESLGLLRHEGAPDQYGPGSWTLTQEWQTHGPVFVIGGVRDLTGDIVAVRLEAKAFHRAASVMQAVIRAIGQGDCTKPPASDWRRIWSGGRKGEPGVMAALLVGLKRRDEQLVAVDNTEDTT